jgi:hypothetical protein
MRNTVTGRTKRFMDIGVVLAVNITKSLSYVVAQVTHHIISLTPPGAPVCSSYPASFQGSMRSGRIVRACAVY